MWVSIRDMAALVARLRKTSDASLTGTRLENFSCAEPNEPLPKRLIIRTIEAITGRRFLLRLYADLLRSRVPDESFWSAVIRGLDLKVGCNDALSRLPRTGPLVIVANHPFGVLDGIILGYLVSRVRNDFAIVTSSTVFYQTEEIRPHLLPIDFPKTRAVVEDSLLSRQAAISHLRRGGVLVIFPAGKVSNSIKFWSRKAVDADWKNFTARLIVSARAPVVPFYIAGQNSRTFQMAGHINMRLRQILFFKEIKDKIGSVLRVQVGELIPYNELDGVERTKLMDHLRRKTYDLETDPPDQTVSAVNKTAPMKGRRLRLIA